MAAVLLAAVLIGSPAAAAIKVATYTGIIGGGTFDYYGIFGPIQTYLDGQTFYAQYKYDTSLGFDDGSGGIYGYGAPNPVISGTVKIGNSPPIAFSNPDFSAVVNVFGPVNSIGVVANYSDGYNTQIAVTSGSLEIDENGPGPFWNYSPADRFDTGQGIYITADISSVSVVDYVAPAPTTSVPEPTAWVLMISGFATVGMAARRRRVALA